MADTNRNSGGKTEGRNPNRMFAPGNPSNPNPPYPVAGAAEENGIRHETLRDYLCRQCGAINCRFVKIADEHFERKKNGTK